MKQLKLFDQPSQNGLLYNLGIGCLFGIVYWLGAQVGHLLSLNQSVATSWPPSGIYLMALVAAPRKRCGYLIASGMLANIVSDTWFNGKPLFFSLAMTCANTVEAVVGALYIRRNFASTFSLERLPDIKRLLIVSSVAPMISAAIAAPAAVWYAKATLVNTFFVWWVADCVGILTVAPLTWAFLTWSFEHRSNWWRTAELMCSFVVLGMASAIVFFGYFPTVEYPFLLMPLLYWPALRFGTVAVASHIGVMAIIMIYATQHQFGPFAHSLHQAVVLQAFLATCAVPFLALAAMWHEREEAAEEMERRIEKRTRQLEEADRRKDHFLAVLAHELRNPLAPLTHALAVWPSVAAHPQQLDELRVLMSNQLRHMSGLIDDLLDVSRIAGGKILLRQELLDVRETLNEAVQSSHSQSQAAGHSVQVFVPAEPIWVKGDRARLCQIVGNLLNNAIKYTGKHGQIELRAQVHAGQAHISIIDNGPGIPASQLERIFELFTQVDQTLERAHGGLGIGLTLVKNLVELHGGSVFAESQGLGHGSTFRITLPLADAKDHSMNLPPETPQQSPSIHHSQLPTRRILVVDDTQASGKMLSLLLKSLGQEVEICIDGPSALTKVLEFQPSLIFLDIAMPGMSGYEVAMKLKSDPHTASIVLVAMTGFGQASDRQRAFECGFDHHMIKPANLDSLKQVIRGN